MTIREKPCFARWKHGTGAAIGLDHPRPRPRDSRPSNWPWLSPVTPSLFFCALNPCFDFNRDGHQFMPGGFQTLCNLAFETRQPGTTKTFLSFTHDTSGIRATRRSLRDRFHRNFAEQRGAQGHDPATKLVYLLLHFLYCGLGHRCYCLENLQGFPASGVKGEESPICWSEVFHICPIWFKRQASVAISDWPPAPGRGKWNYGSFDILLRSQRS